MHFGKIFADGYNFDGDYNYYDSILEYDITGDEFREVGKMTEARTTHAISVVQYEDFSIGAEIPSMI